MDVTYYCLEVLIMKDNLGYVHVYCGDGREKLLLQWDFVPALQVMDIRF